MSDDGLMAGVPMQMRGGHLFVGVSYAVVFRRNTQRTIIRRKRLVCTQTCDGLLTGQTSGELPVRLLNRPTRAPLSHPRDVSQAGVEPANKWHKFG